MAQAALMREESGVQQDSAQEAHGWPIEWHSRDLCHPQVGLLSSYGVLGGRGEFQWDPVTKLLKLSIDTICMP